MAKKRPTAAEREYLAKVAALGCIICGRNAEIHHIRSMTGMGKRASHFDVLPLCPEHHRTGNHGIALHAGKKTWESIHGTQEDLLERVNRRLSNETGNRNG